MPPRLKKKSSSRSPILLVENDRARLAEEILRAGRAEVLSAATLTPDGIWTDLRILARGNHDSAPAVINGLRPGDVLLHNHPSGNLKPSAPDMHVASICGNSGIGFAIHNNECTDFYVVVEPHIVDFPDPLNVDEMLDFISYNGRIAEFLPNFEERHGQKELMKLIVSSLNQRRHAILEGETGIGKSMAYLIPAIHFAKKHQCRVAVSTNTINLQHQLVNKDLPLLASVIPFEFKYCLIKGRRNYICLRKIQEYLGSEDGEFLLETEEVGQFHRLVAWAEKTYDGSLSDLNWVPLDSLWEKLACDKDSCPGISCGEYKDCFFYSARRRAAEADILVVNHHLLFSDLALRAATSEYSQTAVIPAFKAVVLDEAHNLEDTATRHFGYRSTSLGFQRLLGKIYQKRGRRESGTFSSLYTTLSFGHGNFSAEERASLLEEISVELIASRLEIGDLSRSLFENLIAFFVDPQNASYGEHRLRIGPREENRREFETLVHFAFKLRDECRRIANRMKKFFRKLQAVVGEDEDEKYHFDLALTELSSYANRLEEFGAAINILFDVNTENRELYVHFFTVLVRKSGIYPAFHSLPIVVARPMLDFCFKPIKSAILVSGTLTTRKDFSFIKNRLGLNSDELDNKPLEGRFPSPFNYAQQARLFIPTDIPDPSSCSYTDMVARPLLDIIRSSRGGALVLCTSYAHLDSFYHQLSGQLCAEGLECYRQGELERHFLLELFKEDGNAVLFATDSFWEGVDVPGSALRNLIITRLPFATPNDPVLEARNEKIKQQGGNPFRDYQLPMAAIKLKQGFGRLIRKKSDRGAVWILDRRIVTKSYGNYFLESLPELPVLRGKVSVLTGIAERFYTENYAFNNCSEVNF
ncbi:MAG: ATP-dependent DNA helicase DinG [Candidatus Rifleibacteriota bacterium]